MSGELKYGMHIKLEAKSPLPGPDKTIASKPLSVGLYAKHNLVCLGSPDRPDGATFTLVSTGNNSGDTVLYGDKVILVDILTGNVLNYLKIGTWTSGYVSLAEKNLPGELHVIFQCSGKKAGTPIMIDDVKSSFRVTVSVCSAKDNKIPPTPITIQKKQTSSVLGGYVMRDESGQHVQFSLVYVDPEYVADKIASIGTSISIPVSPSIPSRLSVTSGPAAVSSPSFQSERTSFSTQNDQENILRYGDKIKLYATNGYHDANNSQGGYVGIYMKHRLASIGPLQNNLEDKSLFEISEFTIRPTGKSKNGDIVRYASTLTLVDQYGNVWNNKFTGTWGNGFITALTGKTITEREDSAELDISFQPMSHSLLGYPIHTDDAHIYIDIEKSYRVTSKYNTRLRSFKKKSSQLVGGYLICLPNSGKPVTFKIERAQQYQSNQSTQPAAEQTQQGTTHDDAKKALEAKRERKKRKLERQKWKIEYQKKLDVYKKKSQEYAQILNDRVKNKRDSSRTPDRLRYIFQFLGAICLALSISQYTEPYSTFSRAKFLLYILLTCFSFAFGFSKFFKVPDEKTSLLDTLPVRPEPPIVENHDNNSDDDNIESDISEGDINEELGDRDGSDDEDEKKDAEESIEVDTENGRHQNNALIGYQDWENVPLPERFIRAEKGNEVTARARFVKTMHWFDDNRLWTILERPHPLYRFIKKATHHFFAGRGKNGNCVYYERPKSVKIDILQKANVNYPDLLYHFIYITEYLYQVLDTDPNAKCFSVVDADGVGLSDLTGSVADYMKQIAYLTGTHYPERSFAIFVLNAPFSFRLVWNIVKGFVDPVTQQKTHIMGGKKDYLPRLRTLVDDDQIPPSYGGSSDFAATIDPVVDFPDSSMEPQFNHIEYFPISQEEQDLLAIADKANWKFINENPGTIIPKPELLRTTREAEDAHQQQLAGAPSQNENN